MRTITAFIVLSLLLAPTGDAQSADVVEEYAELVDSDSTDGRAWYQLAGDARDAGRTDIAASALDMAQQYEFSPLAIGLERARVAVLDDRPEAAIAALQAIADSGFTSVRALTNDEIINSLAGNAAYDGLVATMAEQAYPCEHLERFRDFDFWIGDWEVRGASGQLAGYNTIRAEQHGCVITEFWTDIFGGTGMSINYLDDSTGQWTQVWTAESGSQIIIKGGLTDEGMSLVGTLHGVGGDTTSPFRGLWTPLPDGRVRQFFEQSNDDGETWTPWFEGFYSRIDDEAEE
jgi:hypothetical protein